MRNSEPCRFLPYNQARKKNQPEGVIWRDVSSHADHPWNLFSPYYQHGGIPVPGMKGRTSDTVEGIWQGLKVIKGETADRYFKGRGRKRGGKPTGHKFGDEKRLLKIEAARRRIYIPAYEWMLENCIPEEYIESVMENIYRGIPQYFYDYESNGVISKDLPLAHASVLVKWFNRKAGLK